MDAVQWFDARGTLVWTEEQISVEGLKSSYKIEESFLAHYKSKPIACMFLQESDSYYWPEMQDDSSLFLHKLVVLRAFKGTGCPADDAVGIRICPKAGEVLVEIGLPRRQAEAQAGL